MKLINYGLSALALVIVGCMTNIIPGSRMQLRNAISPMTRFLGGGGGRRNLKADVEAAFPQFIVPEDRVEYPKQRLAGLKSRLKDIPSNMPWGSSPSSHGDHPPPSTSYHFHQQYGRGRAMYPKKAAPAAGEDNSNLSPSSDKENQPPSSSTPPPPPPSAITGNNPLHPSPYPHHPFRRILPGWGRNFNINNQQQSSINGRSSTTSGSSNHAKERGKFRIPLPKRKLGIVKIHPLPPDKTPLVALVNSKSGGRQGKNLLKKLRSALSKAQVFDIQKIDMKEALRLYAALSNPITLLVCGGDGTASRVFETVDSMEWKAGLPKIAILPLGTGNDLARVLDWNQDKDWSGGYFSGDMDAHLFEVFGDLNRALERRMDRWELRMTPGTAIPSLDRHKQPVKYMLGYLGIGVDGKVALDFHKLREKAPFLFLSPTLNKFYYALMGVRDFFVRSCKNLPDKVELWCDGKEVQLPPQTESFVILNINSHAGGVELWPELPATNPSTAAVETFKPSKFDDGYLEVVAIMGVLHLGRIRVGLAGPIRLAQAKEVRIKTKSFLPGQVDGEPWRLPRCELTLRHKGQAPVLQHVSKELLQYSDWLVGQGKIDAAAKDQLLKAFKRSTSI